MSVSKRRRRQIEQREMEGGVNEERRVEKKGQSNDSRYEIYRNETGWEDNWTSSPFEVCSPSGPRQIQQSAMNATFSQVYVQEIGSLAKLVPTN